MASSGPAACGESGSGRAIPGIGLGGSGGCPLAKSCARRACGAPSNSNMHAMVTSDIRIAMGFARPSWVSQGTASGRAELVRVLQPRFGMIVSLPQRPTITTLSKFGIRKADCELSCGGVIFRRQDGAKQGNASRTRVDRKARLPPLVEHTRIHRHSSCPPRLARPEPAMSTGAAATPTLKPRPAPLDGAGNGTTFQFVYISKT